MCFIVLIHFVTGMHSFGRDQTCAMLLGLASGNTFMDPGEQELSSSLSTLSTDLAAVAKQAFYDFGDRPRWEDNSTTYGAGEISEVSSMICEIQDICHLAANVQGTVIFSGRLSGFSIYLARLVRPFWKSKITKPGCAHLLCYGA